MKDRESTYPGRVTLTPVTGETNKYDLTMADEPTENGDAPTKENLLSDVTATAIHTLTGITPNTVNDALSSITGSTLRIYTSSYNGTGTYGSSNPTIITFPFVPKFLFISLRYANLTNNFVAGDALYHCILPYDAIIAIKDLTTPYFRTVDNSSIYICFFTLSADNLTLSFYNTESAAHQLNENTMTYEIISIG